MSKVLGPRDLSSDHVCTKVDTAAIGSRGMVTEEDLELHRMVSMSGFPWWVDKADAGQALLRLFRPLDVAGAVRNCSFVVEDHIVRIVKPDDRSCREEHLLVRKRSRGKTADELDMDVLQRECRTDSVQLSGLMEARMDPAL